MREFVFTLTYETGVDPLMDTLAAAPEARSTALVCPGSESEVWRLDRVTGPQETVERAAALIADENRDLISVSDRGCAGRRYSDVLSVSARRAVVYTRVSEATRCDAVSLIARRYLTGGVFAEVTRRGSEARWRILMESDEKVGMLYDTVGGTLREGITYRFEHLEDATESPSNPFASLSLRPEQRQVLELAAEMGYYETPRETTLDDLAAELDCPRSTVSYRLRRAEAELVAGFISTT
ncbi:helix-turn-helix domain-containing protein [Halosimplex litoreum]|uniref:Helix-turn-helix domain-containing protein n=1 Tax=Halosimplex litoreum TaxID=1198301 RepID=A0A7T3FXY0_9EURY|nr:helix-turn-helix domain-containing protein [Halosimplex litoreum]QPV62617.1 helix-turn-helix domain-containing protein [Halosimplex litoreum]